MVLIKNQLKVFSLREIFFTYCYNDGKFSIGRSFLKIHENDFPKEVPYCTNTRDLFIFRISHVNYRLFISDFL